MSINLDTLYGWGQSGKPVKNVPIQMDIQWSPTHDEDDPATATMWSHAFTDHIQATVYLGEVSGRRGYGDSWIFDITAEISPNSHMSLLPQGEEELGYEDEMNLDAALKQANIEIVRWFASDGASLIEDHVVDHE